MGGALDRRALGQQPQVQPPPPPELGENGASRRLPIRRRRALTSDARYDLSANSREAADAPAAESCPGNWAPELKGQVRAGRARGRGTEGPLGRVFGEGRDPGTEGARRPVPCAAAAPRAVHLTLKSSGALTTPCALRAPAWASGRRPRAPARVSGARPGRLPPRLTSSCAIAPTA